MLVSKGDLAKYPFTREAIEYIRELDVKVDELVSPEYVEIINRAEQRVEDALIDRIVKWETTSMHDVEILSFPMAILLVVAIGDDFLKRRYALAEAKRVDGLLQREEDGKLVGIAESSFNWRVKRIPKKINQPYDYSLNFVDYLKNAPGFHDDKWKLVNRTMVNGEVFLKKDELARLISEEVRKYVQKTVENNPKTQLPPLFVQRLERINQVLAQRKESTRLEELPKTAIIAAYPPCIKRLYDSLLAGQHISHVGRFTLTSFLLNLGMNPEELLKLYTSISDFSERLTRYQVEHIAGKKGSGTKYTPPSCDTLKTHGLCLGPDDLCPKIKHPLSYYRRKIRQMKTRGEK